MAVFFLTFGFHSTEGINVIEWVGAGPRTNLNERSGLYSEKKTNNKNQSFFWPYGFKSGHKFPSQDLFLRNIFVKSKSVFQISFYLCSFYAKFTHYLCY